VSYQYTTRYYGQFELTFAGDLFGQHDGLYAESAYRYPLRGERWMFTPTIGYAWNSSKLNNHLYGVSSSEAARTNVDTFNPDGDAEFFIGARGLLKITQHISFSAGVRYTNLEGDLEKSPLLKKTDSTSFNLGLTYSF
jgi:outer membrane protein